MGQKLLFWTEVKSRFNPSLVTALGASERVQARRACKALQWLFDEAGITAHFAAACCAAFNFQAEASVQFLRSLEIEADIVEGLGHGWGFHDVTV